MHPNFVKHKLHAGQASFGTMLFEFNTTGIARLTAAAGAEFAVFDMEHSGWDVETIRRLVATTPKDRLVPIVRVPATEYHFVARVLDMGAMGVMIPMCEDVEQAQRLAISAKYPPIGRRGAAFAIAHDDYKNAPITETVRSANDEVLLIAQIETARGLENVEPIAAVPEIDALWLGLYDLTNSLGVPGQMQHPQVIAATDRFLVACRTNHKAAAVLAMNVSEAKAQLQRGFTMIAYSGDVWIYQSALRRGLEELRSSS